MAAIRGRSRASSCHCPVMTSARTAGPSRIRPAGLSMWCVDTQPPASPPEEIELTAETMPVWDSTDLSFIVAGRRPAAAAAEPGIWRVRPTGLVTRVADGTGPVASDGRGGLALLAGSGPGGSVDPLRMAFLAPGGTAPLSLTSGAGPADRWPAFAPNGD